MTDVDHCVTLNEIFSVSSLYFLMEISWRRWARNGIGRLKRHNRLSQNLYGQFKKVRKWLNHRLNNGLVLLK